MQTCLFARLSTLIVVVAFSSSPRFHANAESCSVPASVDIAVFENQSWACLELFRSGDTHVVQMVEYFTMDGPPTGVPSFPASVARAGVDYVAHRGTATFGIGERAASVDLQVLDNGLLDGVRDFSLVLVNASPGLQLVPARFGDLRWIRILDNEAGAAVDPLFAPEGTAATFRARALPMPDGRVLLSRDAQGLGLIMLRSDGGVDVDFGTRLARGQFGNLVALEVMSDGRILAKDWAEPSRRIVRLLPDGSLDALFAFPDSVFCVAAQPDGKILLSARDTDNVVRLRRLNLDGSADPSFIATWPDCWRQIAFRADGKIYVDGFLKRLNSDGSRDRGFSPPHWAEEVPFFLRTNRKLLVGPWTGNQDRFVHLNDDGGVEAGFELEVPQVLSTEVWRRLPDLVERSDGRLFMGLDEADLPDVARIGTVVQWRPDGSLRPNLALTGGGPGGCGYDPMQISSTGADRLIVTGWFHTVDGFPRPGLARLSVNPPEHDFRVLTPAEFHRSEGSARVRVVRTGATTNAASVSFRTQDNTAQAGEDYVTQSGRLEFAPLEVSKEIVVPLLARNGVDAHQRFDFELSQPSAGYEVIAATPIIILPDLRIVPDSLRPAADGSITLSARGTVPGRLYRLIGSVDLRHWDWAADAQASGNTVTFENVPHRPPSQFFRAFQANY